MTSSFRLAVAGLVVLTSLNAFAQRRARGAVASSSYESTLSYDLGASSGSYNGSSYSEITLGLNWQLAEWFNWRNSVFSRQGSGIETVQGLDSSARFMTSAVTDGGGFGVDAFAGPGVRFASKSHNAIFGEAGLTFRLGGLRIGFGAKLLNYISDREDSAGAKLPRNDTQYFIILAGGGTL